MIGERGDLSLPSVGSGAPLKGPQNIGPLFNQQGH
jgi:hypothetical protein